MRNFVELMYQDEVGRKIEAPEQKAQASSLDRAKNDYNAEGEQEWANYISAIMGGTSKGGKGIQCHRCGRFGHIVRGGPTKQETRQTTNANCAKGRAIFPRP